ncbi:MAG: GNAT family N-acetyltransferase [Bacteroidetes bacterium]|nr:GNAT family N-acetyltransferase [Bacteroidota bacterium]
MIKEFIRQFELDNRALLSHQFLVAKENNEVLGFGRIREHEDCSELCSLGVTEPKRLQGIGKQLVKALILKAQQPLYLVCIIPDFFIPFGFTVVSHYPNALEEKVQYCTSELIVPEKYVVMKYTRRDS